MKTAEEWANELYYNLYGCDSTLSLKMVKHNEDIVKQIQLDAVADKDKSIAHLCEDSVKFQEDLKKALGLTDKDCHDGNGDITEEAILNAILNAIPKRISKRRTKYDQRTNRVG